MSATSIIEFATQYLIITEFLTYIFGLIGNLLNVTVFTQLKLFRNNRCVFYIIVESICNILFEFLLLAIAILTIIYGNDQTNYSKIWCQFRYMLFQPLLLTTFYTICFTATDQFFSTNYRFYQRQLCTMKLSRYLIFFSICLWIGHTIAFILNLDIQPSVGCIISNSIFRRYSTYFFYPLLTGLIPVVIASFFSSLAFRNVRRIIRRQIPIVRRRLDQQMTAVVLLRVIFFVILLLPYCIYRIYIINFPISPSQPMAYAIGILVQVISTSLINLNSMISFYLFFISSSRFRSQLRYVLKKKIWRSFKSHCCFRSNQISPQNTNMESQDEDD